MAGRPNRARAKSTARTLRIGVVATVLFAFAGNGFGQNAQEQAILNGIDFEQRLNEPAPLDVRLVDEGGQTVELSRYFGRKPVVLALVYYECPMLCTEILNGLLHTMKQ